MTTPGNETSDIVETINEEIFSTPPPTQPDQADATPAVTTNTATTNTATTNTATTNSATTDAVATTIETTVTATTPTTTTTTTKTTTTTTTTHATIDTSITDSYANSNDEYDFRENGIFDFMTPEVAIELYRKIHSIGLPELDWKFHGRRKPNDPNELNDSAKQCDNLDGSQTKDQLNQDTSGNLLDNTEFDFDESFSELQAEASAISDSLQLKNRPEPGSERKANLSDIMSDILKETSHTETP